jgi:hypothetical protein
MDVAAGGTHSTTEWQPISVFLCHSSSDKPAVRELHARLLSDGIKPWLDEEDLLPGHDWEMEIRKAIRQSAVVVVCLSHNSVNKVGYLQKEVRLVLDVADEQPEGSIYLIPARLEGCEIPERLRRWQWVDLFDESGYVRLMKSIQSRVGRASSAASGKPPSLAQVILSTYIDGSIDISDMLGSSLAAVPRTENRSGWQLLAPVPLTWAQSSWPIRHHNHRVGFLKWIHDDHGHTAWELALLDGRWEEEGKASVHGFPPVDWPFRYLLAPPAKRGGGVRGWSNWADPADALLTLAGWHYCPHAALTTLFRLVDEGVSAEEASRVVHIVPAVGEHLVRRALRIRDRSGKPLLEQVGDFLPLRESDWKVGLI